MWLSHFLHMKKDRNMLFTGESDSFFERLTHTGIIPCADSIYVYAVGSFISFKSSQGFRDGSFGGLVTNRDGDSIAIVPYKNSERDLLNSRGIHRFPEMAFAGRRISDCTETDFISMV